MNNFQFSIFNFQSKTQFSIFQQRESGFTLLEMVISLGIFSALVISAIGVTIGVSGAQLHAAEVQAIQDNIRFSLELITKEMRTGSGYQLSSACSGVLGSEISFTTSLDEQRIYYLDNADHIMRVSDDLNQDGSLNCLDATVFTAEDVEVERFIIRISGASSGPADGQPRVTISLKVKARDPKIQQGPSMDLETTVTQRLRDL